MSEVAIITDSTVDLPPGVAQQYGIECLPQILIWNEDTFLDGVDISSSEFYPRLVRSDTLPTTSQVTVAMFRDAFEPHVARGIPILAMLVSSEISGTVQSALGAKEYFPQARIEIVDSRFVSMGLGFQVLAAARALMAGKSFQEVVEFARKAHEYAGIIFVVDTLEYLHKGGRIGGAARLLGTALKMKPVLEFADGQIEAVERVRTKKKAKARMLELIEQRLRGHENVCLAAIHADAEDEARELLEKISARCQPAETFISMVGPVVGTHAGPGTVGLAFYAGPYLGSPRQ